MGREGLWRWTLLLPATSCEDARSLSGWLLLLCLLLQGVAVEDLLDADSGHKNGNGHDNGHAVDVHTVAAAATAPAAPAAAAAAPAVPQAPINFGVSSLKKKAPGGAATSIAAAAPATAEAAAALNPAVARRLAKQVREQPHAAEG